MANNNKKSEIEKFKTEIERLKKELKKRKKYGLVWEEKPEEVVEMCKEKLPVLKEVKNKKIMTDRNRPVNLLIEGDNYHALSVLNYTHAKKVDVIYIDPPFNTGSSKWIYNNRYIDSEDAFRHSKWLSFMEKRLKLAKNLLRDGGSIIIAIDNYELFNLGALCDEIFGEENRLGIIAVVHKPEGRNQEKFFSTSHEYMLVYARNRNKVNFQKAVLSDDIKETFDRKDDRGKFKLNNFLRAGGGDHNLRKNKPHFFYSIYVSKDLNDIILEKRKNYYEILPITKSGQKRTWKTIKKTFIERLNNGDIIAEKDNEGKIQIYEKYREEKGQLIKTYWIDKRYNAINYGTNVLENILGNKIFDYPKSIYLVLDILKITSRKDSIILDYFAGSGTTGHAVLELNKEDNGNRKFILCTSNENNNGNGYKIAEDICYPRVKKVIEGYKNLKGEKVAGLGGNLKYFKTNFVDYDEPTDKNKIKLTEQATEMLCVKEGTFEKVLDQKNFKIFKNTNHYTGIIFDQVAIPAFKKRIKDIKGKFSVYVFSLGDETFDDEFKNIKQKIQLFPIPEAILRVYRRIFK